MSQKGWCYVIVHPNLKAKIDREDYARVTECKWRITKGTTGHIRVVTSVRTQKGVRNITLGKFLMNSPKGKQVYPRRFNEGLDYRKENLIVCTLQERQRMLPKTRLRASSNFRGVSQSKHDKKWRAAIEVKGKAVSLGYFVSEKKAAQAYNEAARAYFGESAYQNPVNGRNYKRRE